MQHASSFIHLIQQQQQQHQAAAVFKRSRPVQSAATTKAGASCVNAFSQRQYDCCYGCSTSGHQHPRDKWLESSAIHHWQPSFFCRLSRHLSKPYIIFFCSNIPAPLNRKMTPLASTIISFSQSTYSSTRECTSWNNWNKLEVYRSTTLKVRTEHP